MNPADKRLSELLDKWLTSLELHLKYTAMDEASYRKVQPWPPHDRPSRWIVEMAVQKVRQLKEQLEQRIAMGDARFADSLELMGFLTNLVGSQHIQRFIPLAQPQTESEVTPTATATVETVRALEHTREMPRPKIQAPQKTAAKREAKAPAKNSTGTHKAESSKAEPKASPAPKANPTQRDQVVVADAVRLLRWGRKWHEIAELIARMADRPSITEVRRILRDHKPAIERERNKE